MALGGGAVVLWVCFLEQEQVAPAAVGSKGGSAPWLLWAQEDRLFPQPKFSATPAV